MKEKKTMRMTMMREEEDDDDIECYEDAVANFATK
jgi:hypothetical protein